MVLNYDAYEETIEDQKKKDNKLKELEDKINLQQQVQEEQKRLQQEQRQAQGVQQSLLEAIAKTMNIHNSGAMERDLRDKNSDLNADEFKELTYEQKLQGISEIKADTNKVIQNTLLPEIANISKYMKDSNMKDVSISIARIMADKGFREMFFDITKQKVR
jgi:hypothetical protein